MGYIAHGTAYSFNSVEVGGLISITPGGRTKGDVKTSDNDSEFDEEYVPGIREGGTLTLEMMHEPLDTGQQELAANYEADREVVENIITLPEGASAGSGQTTFTFDGYVNDMTPPTLPLNSNDPATRSVVIKVAGPITEVAT